MLDDTERRKIMCLFPKNAFLKKFIDFNGEYRQKLVFEKPSKGDYEEMQVPCGKCYECLMQYTNEWSYRIMNELSSHDGKGCFITLTYKKNPINLVKRDLQLFLKRLRRKLEPLKIRYFACGEYGSKNLRPHFHLVIFGWSPSDLVFLRNVNNKYDIYKSKFIADIWQNGFISVANLTIEVSRYVAKYMQKLQENEIKKRSLVLPFTTMSTKPGIGYNWFIENYQCLDTDKIWYNGNYIKLPRYYLKVAEQNFDFAKVSNIKELRKIRSNIFRKDYKQLKIKREILLSKGLTIS